MDKVIELKKVNNEVVVHIENVGVVDLLSFLTRVLIGVAKDAKEKAGIVAYGQFLEDMEKTFSAKSIDFLVNNIDRDDVMECARKELFEKE